jgi:hypothetical protein
VEGEDEFEVKNIVDSVLRGQSKKLFYKVEWLGYENTSEQYSWEPASNLSNSPDAIDNFHSTYPAKPGPLSKLFPA